MARVLRTPEDRFEALPDYPFAPNYIDIDDPDLGPIRQHYLDEGPQDGPLVLLMHGEPSWSYLYRSMIPPLVEAGFRVIAPDLIGFGKSDKPARKSDYSYARHVEWMLSFLEQLDLDNITLFCQDWGGLIGLRLVAAEPDRFARLVISNTGLPEGAPMSKQFMRWRRMSRYSPVFPIGRILNRASTRELSEGEMAAYDAPFPSRKYKAGARIFPSLVPIARNYPGAKDNREAWKILRTFDRPVLTLFGDQDPVTAGWDEIVRNRIPGAKGQAHRTIEGGHHFIQEDAGPELAEAIIGFAKGSETQTQAREAAQ
ncbi:haloalkane dehalogenase [Erythrobacter rubeus]|uniref:Haloalkane dehalogenase n=1 Tax=Erythrobacter rubeus TaxID=2760803 RepID=A0ABR8KMV2_9SPHN|nr:haloalkane dehalogenase [Erythrobacter rubeus]MBD2841885.1 haloalkane dehalogenase [Erythrobacter rubeus]